MTEWLVSNDGAGLFLWSAGAERILNSADLRFPCYHLHVNGTFISIHRRGLYPSLFTSVGWFQVSLSTEARVLTWSFSSWSFFFLRGSRYSYELLRFHCLQYVRIKSLQAYFYFCWHFWFNFLWTLKECAARWDVHKCTCAGVHVFPPTHQQRHVPDDWDIVDYTAKN